MSSIKKLKYVITNPGNDRIQYGRQEVDGWVFTEYLSMATRFDTSEAAEEVIKRKYWSNEELYVSTVRY